MRQIPSLNKEHGTNSRKAESLRADRNHEEAQRKKGSVAWTTWFPPGRLSTSVKPLRFYFLLAQVFQFTRICARAEGGAFS